MSKIVIYSLKCIRCASVFTRQILPKPDPKTGKTEVACCWGGCNGLAQVIDKTEVEKYWDTPQR